MLGMQYQVQHISNCIALHLTTTFLMLQNLLLVTNKNIVYSCLNVLKIDTVP